MSVEDSWEARMAGRARERRAQDDAAHTPGRR